MIQKAGGWTYEGPVVFIPGLFHPLSLEGVRLPDWTLDENHIEVFLGASESLGQDAAVALIHEKKNSSGLAASQVR